MNQILPETGIFVSGGASPTLLNNVLVNVQSPIIQERPSVGNRNAVRPSAVIIGGSTYQYIEPATSFANMYNPVEGVPTNVPNTALDFNFLAG